MPLRRRRDAGVALRAQPAAPDEVEQRPAEPVTPAGDSVKPSQPPPRPRGKRWPVVLASLGAVLILGAAVAVSWLQAQDDDPGDTAPAAAVVGDSRSLLIVVAGEDGRATSLALFVSDGLEDHRVLVTPPALTMQIPGYRDGSLGEALVI
ncbi:MAG: hypothetical protein GY778_22345, partial [bacterium]|nr:hypothetical protein [bacterium]